MSTVVKIGSKSYVEPGSYAFTKYNPTSVINVANFGNVMIIDTGLSPNGDYEFSGGSGVNGELNQGLKSVYEFTDYESFNQFTGGGKVSSVARKVFDPLSDTGLAGTAGAPKLYYARAATTVCANIALSIGNNTLTLKCKNEGVPGNGVEIDSVLKAGYSAKIIESSVDAYKLQIYKGTFAGVDEDGEPYGAYSIEKSTPILIFESNETASAADLYAECSSNKSVLAHFQVSFTAGASDVIVAEVAKTLATGGTTQFLSDTEMDSLLDSISELDVTFFLCVNKGVDAATNGKILTFLKSEAKFQQFMAVYGGSDSSDLFGTASTSSEYIAKFYNSGNVIVIHGQPIVPRLDNNGTKKLSPLYLAASIVGLAAGNAPQTPLTFKRIGYQNFVYDLKKKERERALQLGIMHVRNIGGYWCVNQGITSLQDNKRTIALDGQSLELSIEMIKSQINKELVLEGESRFVGQTAAQSSPESIKNFTETKLASLVAKQGSDNLIISWKNVKVTAANGDYTTTYDFVPNVPVNKTFFIGNMVDFKF